KRGWLIDGRHELRQAFDRGNRRRNWKGGLEFGGAGLVFDSHVFEFTGIEDFSAFLALYKFRVLLTRNNTHARMLADFHADSLGWKFSGLDSTHSPGKFWVRFG